MSTTCHYPVRIEKANKGDYDARFIMSAGSPDRVRDTIDPAAYPAATKGLQKLIALWQHDPDRPIGYWADMKAATDELSGYIKLAGTTMGAFIKQLITDEVPLGASISFRGVGTINELGGIHYTKIALLECSIVSVPAHPRAVQIAKSFGIELPSSEADPYALGMSAREFDIRSKALNSICAARRALKGN